jgi:hypothetical protein
MVRIVPLSWNRSRFGAALQCGKSEAITQTLTGRRRRSWSIGIRSWLLISFSGLEKRRCERRLLASLDAAATNVEQRTRVIDEREKEREESSLF